jgi:hypothetical protein
MTHNTPAIRTLVRAIEAVGKERVADILGVSPDRIDEWLEDGVVPLSAYLATLSIVASAGIGGREAT